MTDPIDGLEELGLPPIGHNEPPPEAVEKSVPLIATVDRWLAERPIIVDAEQAGAAQLLVDQLRACRTDLVGARAAECAPFDDAIERIRERYRPTEYRLDVALEKMRTLVTVWLRRDRERIARDAAERQRVADEAKEAARIAAERAAAKPSVDAELDARRATAAAADAEAAAGRAIEPARVRGDYSKRAMSLRSNWKARVVDRTAAISHFVEHPVVREAMVAAIVKVCTRLAKEAKGAPPIPPGVEFYNDEAAT